MHRGVLGICLAAAVLGTARPSGAQLPVFGRLEAGTLNAHDPLNATLAIGASLGLVLGPSRLALHVVRQSWNRNSGVDVSRGRTFAMLDWELAAKPSGPWGRQAFLRLGGGWLFQSPYTSTVAADLGVGLRYRLTPYLFAVGALVDQVAFIRRQDFTSCDTTFEVICTTATIPTQAQHNFGLLVDLELHP